MTWTLTDYITGDQHVPIHFVQLADHDGPTGYIEQWLTWIEQNFLRGIPSPSRQRTIDEFKQRARGRATACRQANTGEVGLRGEMDRTARDYLDAQEQNLIDATPVPAPVIPHDADYTTPGVMCIGTYVGADGQASVTWMNRYTYSGNHGRARGDDYVIGGGGSKRRLRRVIVQNNENMLTRAKPNIALLQLLGDARHAEDGWFMTHYDDFVTAVNALVPAQPLPALAGRNLWQQKATVPRVEFLQSMPPCSRDDNDTQTGCRNYFRELRAGITVANLPILVYHYRIFEAGETLRGVHTIAANGALVAYPNRWLAHGG